MSALGLAPAPQPRTDASHLPPVPVNHPASRGALGHLVTDLAPPGRASSRLLSPDGEQLECQTWNPLF